jgi:hypothetical protein
MGEYLRREYKPSQEPTDVSQFLIIPPLTIPPDEP